MRSLIASACLLRTISSSAVNPIEKVLELMDSLTAKITAEGEAEDKAFKEFFEWCDDASSNAKFSIKTATSEKGSLEATIAKSVADDKVATSEIEKLTAAISDAEGELNDATGIREKEKADFVTVETELVDTVDTLDRAIGLMERQASKNPALLQRKVDSTNTQELLQVLDAVINVAGVRTGDRQKLTALVQSSQQDQDDDDDSTSAPEPAAYKSQSGSIIDILADMKEKSEGELQEARKGEASAAQNFAILKMSLEDQIAADTKDLNDAKSTKNNAAETKSTAEGDLKLALEDLADGQKALETVGSDCMTSASNHEASQKSRNEELNAIGVAKKAIAESTAGASQQQYSFFQIDSFSHAHSHSDLVHLEVVNLVKNLAAKQHSAALNQLGDRIKAVLKYGASSGEDPFGKIKGMIADMISKLEQEAQAEAVEKAYCDEEMAKTEAKKEELTTDVERLTTKIDQKAAKSTKLKEEVAELQNELAALAKTTYEMDNSRRDENKAYVAAKADLDAGIAGVQKALQVLREYYNSAALIQQPSPPEGHSAAGGAGGGIIGMLEVVESDFSKTLSKITLEEDAGASTYEERTHENSVSKTLKEQDVKYKTAESKSLDKQVAEHSSDKAGLNTQLAAVLEYYKMLTDRCVAKPESYEERKKRREDEISGLKQALQILDSETALVQKSKKGVHRLRLH